MSQKRIFNDSDAVIHEMANALTIALGWLDRIEDCDDLQEAKSFTQIARSKTYAAVQLARSILGISSNVSLKTISALFSQLQKEMLPLVEQAGVVFRVKWDAMAGDVIVNSCDALLQILTNLILNSISVLKPAQSVELIAQIDGNTIDFSVVDEGPGIPFAIRSKILQEPVKGRLSGTGIGLYYSSLLAKRAGGALRWSETESGCRFDLAWPKQNVATRIGGQRILILEDDDSLAELLRHALLGAGHRLEIVSTADDFENALKSELPFDVYLIDLSPLGDHAEEKIERVLLHNPQGKHIVISGRSTFSSSGSITVLRKPFEIRTLLQLLEVNVSG